MPVRINRVYTRVGDSGTTALGDGTRVPKTDPRLGAYADVDETNSVIGVALALGSLPDDISRVLRRVQNDLFDVGADLSTPVIDDPPYPPLRITQDYIDRLEDWCDEFNERVGKLTSFILPGGSPGAALLHQARTVARRAERSAWALVEADPDGTNTLAVTYLNRLSDLLFILARVANPDGDVLWKPGGER
ncbi:cob(I)yrinic acid a,c-diamide adenosyltransferase [Saccharomonospora viridis]|jgi:cob(I)alamin adenosyltransferase|uniref:Corrinoid adenosyltransferase n=2 Tax=Saccharomonospora viridis TaxID=1852 RepID=C7MX13_SACVD|nr:cob(I)yrinic acid a,c-diamide adenosyltransferase [Saccharomonospora viridis]ACU97930.1 ATP:cob(I)alamin adenosyltransferase [Saccharomonospora viridis DSM 43017]KHF45897.1 cob(I)yrinic acid a,c-diamide adenosyltransferase [Saccharomonospora viridis]SFP39972.1 cob(I)alamin adenosyltransferase [Saccharomonospora viridis]